MQSLYEESQSASSLAPWQLLEDALALCRSRARTLYAVVLFAFPWLVLTGIAMATAFGSFILGAATLATSALYGLLAVTTLAALGFVAGNAWVALALSFVFAESAGTVDVRQAYRTTRPFVWPYAWASVLSGLLTIGALGLFIIPGVVVAVWLAFVVFCVFFERQRGMTSVLRSWDHVRGRWLAVALRLLVLGAIAYAVIVPVPELLGTAGYVLLSSVVGIVLQLAVTPFLFAYLYVLYQGLRTSTPAHVYDARRALGLVAVGVVGLVLLLSQLMSLYLAS